MELEGDALLLITNICFCCLCFAWEEDISAEFFTGAVLNGFTMQLHSQESEQQMEGVIRFSVFARCRNNGVLILVGSSDPGQVGRNFANQKYGYVFALKPHSVMVSQNRGCHWIPLVE
jgi:hypothetical protein